MKKLILAPDSYKGTLSASEICDILAPAAKSVWPDCQVISLPLADGGEGTVACFLRALPQAEEVVLPVTGPYYGELAAASYALLGDTALLEVSSCAGLPLVEGCENPAVTTTYGLGEQIRDALHRGAKHILLGLGGSCTNDCGVGMAAALGVRFYDQTGSPFVPQGNTLEQIASYDPSPALGNLAGVSVTALCDIDNPLYGLRGAAQVFAPQKGADQEMVQVLDRNLCAFARMVQAQTALDLQAVPGSGAAGGLGAGVLTFLGGTLKPGIDQILDLCGFDQSLAGADLVITGEGCTDSQSLGGKAVSGLARRCRNGRVPLLVLSGSIGEDLDLSLAQKMGVTALCAINRLAEDYSLSRHKSRENLAFAGENLFRLLAGFGL